MGTVIDTSHNRLLLYARTQPLLIAYLRGEDQDAWRYYLKRGMIKDALNNCKHASQKTQVAGIYADSLFAKERYELAAEYYAKSDKTFEEVTLRFLQKGLYAYLENYL